MTAVYEGYKTATRAAQADGILTQDQANVMLCLGEVARATAEKAGLGNGEFGALLSKAQDFGRVLIGALDSAQEKKTPHALYYRTEVDQVMLEMRAAGAIKEEDLPWYKKTPESVGEQAAGAV